MKLNTNKIVVAVNIKSDHPISALNTLLVLRAHVKREFKMNTVGM